MRKILILLLLSSCFAYSQKKEISIALNAEFETLHPAVNSMMAAVYVQDATLRPLVALNPEGKAYPVLIEKIPTLKNNSAEVSFLEKANWGDGKPVTCEDLKFAWEVGKDPNVSSVAKEEYENIEKIEMNIKNPKKCKLTFRLAKWDFYLNFPRPIAAHLERPIFEANKNQAQAYERNSLFQRAPKTPGLYNGPYRVSELKMGSHVILEPNPYFYGKAPYFQKVVIKFILNSATMEANLRSGNVDMTSSSGLSFDQALNFEKKIVSENLNYKVIFVPGVIFAHVDFNLDHEVLKDLRVRKAFMHAVNKEEMTKAFFEGKQKPALHFSTELDPWYTANPKEISIYPYDKKKAADLLQQAGWILNEKDGYRYKDGKKLMLTITSAADNKLNETIQVFIKSAFKEVGADLSIKNYPARVLFAEILRKRNFDLGFYSWVSSPGSGQRNTFHSQMIPTEKNMWSGSNRPGWKNKNVDQWTDAFDTEFNEKKRIALMKKIMKVYTEELPAMPMYYRSNNSVVPKGLKNYQVSGHNYSEFLKIEEWSF